MTLGTEASCLHVLKSVVRKKSLRPFPAPHEPPLDIMSHEPSSNSITQFSCALWGAWARVLGVRPVVCQVAPPSVE